MKFQNNQKTKDSSSNNSKQEQDSQKIVILVVAQILVLHQIHHLELTKSQKFELEAKGVLTNSDEINWDYIKVKLKYYIHHFQQ